MFSFIIRWLFGQRSAEKHTRQTMACLMREQARLNDKMWAEYGVSRHN